MMTSTPGPTSGQNAAGEGASPQSGAETGDSTLPEFDFNPARSSMPGSSQQPVQTPKQISDQITDSHTSAPGVSRLRFWHVLVVIGLVGLVVAYLHVRSERAMLLQERQTIALLMQAECTQRCIAYGTTVQALGEPIVISRNHRQEYWDDVYQWRAGSDLTLTLHHSHQPNAGEVNVFRWSTNAPQRDAVDVGLKLRQADYALSHVLSDAYWYGRSAGYAAQITLRFLIAPNGRAYNITVLHDATDTMQRRDLDDRYRQIISGIDFGAGHYAPLDQSYTVHSSQNPSASDDDHDDDQSDE